MRVELISELCVIHMPFKAAFLKDIVDPLDFLSEESELRVNDYKQLKYENGEYPHTYYQLKFYLINSLKLGQFPKQHRESASQIKQFTSAEKLLDQIVYLPKSSNPITLYEAISRYGKIPNRVIIRDSRDIFQLVDHYESAKFIYRFYQNQGIVYYSESMTPIYESSFDKIAPKLVEDGVLRRGEEKDLTRVLNIKTMKQLVALIRENQIINDSESKNSSKQELIEKIAKTIAIKELGIPQYFYFLSDSFQALKNWIFREEIYFKVFCMLHQEIEVAHIGMDSIIKELIKIDDLKLASKVCKLYFDNKKYFKMDGNSEEWTDKKINVQRTKLNKLHTTPR